MLDWENIENSKINKFYYPIDEVLEIIRMDVDSSEKRELVSSYRNVATKAIRKVAVRDVQLQTGDILKVGSSWTDMNEKHKVVDFKHDGVELLFVCEDLKGFKLPYDISDIGNSITDLEKEEFIEELMWFFSYSDDNEAEQEIYVSIDQMFEVINIVGNIIEVKMVTQDSRLPVIGLEPANIIEGLTE